MHGAVAAHGLKERVSGIHPLCAQLASLLRHRLRNGLLTMAGNVRYFVQPDSGGGNLRIVPLRAKGICSTRVKALAALSANAPDSERRHPLKAILSKKVELLCSG